MTTTINFNDLSSGTVVDNEYSKDGLTISASGGAGQAMSFDTANPTGNDHDLATSNLQKALIISEDGDSGDPDDNACGGTFHFAFDGSATVTSLTVLDIESASGLITLFDDKGDEIGTVAIPVTGNNGQAVVTIDTAGVARMDVTIAGSGAIDNLVFDAATSGNPGTTGPDYIVEGTSGGEVIDAGYTGDPDGDMIDALDDGGTPPSNDDVVEAGGGDDTVYAGAGDDTVSGGTGNDLLVGDDDATQDGDDLLSGDAGDDTLNGLDGEDTLDGGAGDDLLDGMGDDDLLLGGSGDDRADGGAGNDTLFGDAGGQGVDAVREVFQWDLAPNTGAPNFSQYTGNVTVTFSEDNGGASDNISTDEQNVTGIDTGTLGAVDSTSSLDSLTNGQGNSDTYSLEFSDPVENVSFRVNDVDGDGVVRIQAFDENGDLIEVQLDGGSNVTLLDTDGVAGADTADSNGGYVPDTSAEHSVLVTIPGPVSEIQIFHTQDGSGNSCINVTDVNFDVPDVGAAEGDGDDTLIGGEGDDLIYGNGGDDSIQGNSGADTLFGDDPAAATVVSGNLIFNGSFEITSGMNTRGYGFEAMNGDAPGWTDVNGGAIDFHNDGRGGINPTDGQNWLDLEASPGNGRIGQDVEGVQEGEIYRLTFDAGDKNNEPQSGAGENLIEVYWGGELIAVVDPEAGQMDQYTFEVTGGAGDGSDRLEFVGRGDLDNFGASIDDVELVQLAGTPGDGGDDTIDGGSGNDLIDGQGGDDVLDGGAGDDTLTGGDGADSITGGDDGDTFIGGNDGDTVDGGTGTTSGLDEDDFDILDLTGEGPFRVIGETEDADGNSTSGTIEFLNPDGTPNGDTMSFTEIEEILGDSVNTDPDAVNDSGSGDEDMQITGNVLGNDTDINGDPLEVIDNTDPANGTVTIDASGNYTYTPDPDFNGTDSFTYTVSDGNGGTDTATVNLTIDPVNDDPVAVDDSSSTDFEATVSIDLLANDTDVDGDTLTVTSATVPASEGTLVETAPGVYDFTPAAGFEGTATVSYTISDGNGGTDSAEHTIDVGADPTPADGVVDGEETGELMDPLYDDSGQATDGGGDIIDGADGPNDSIRGNGGDDTINAGEGDDTVDGGDDDDSVSGGLGDDIVDGGDGDDTVRGEDGDDTVSGGEGNDSVTGGAGDDVLDGGDGDDSLTGGSGDDVIDGGDGDDSITGSSGNDTITDLDGDNLITSGPDGLPDLGLPFVPGTLDEDADPNDDRDSITTGDGDDTISAGDDADTIDAGDGDNVIDGGFDADIITSGDGDDSIIGGEGSDTINSGDGDDTIQGGIGTDTANLIDDNVNPANNDDILDNGDDLINAGAGDDIVFGEDDNDTIDGGEGNDSLYGGIDDDTITGGAGDDLIVGGQGADSLDGGLGSDTFTVGTFTDPVYGDAYVEGIGDTIVGGEDPGDPASEEDVLDLNGSVDFDILFEDSIDPTGTSGESGRVVFYTDDTKTTVKGELVFKEIENVIPCFTPGAMIATPRGEVPVETLREGDKVITRDNGIQEIRWTGNRTLHRTELAEGQNLKPILIKAGSLGRNLPERDMLVSPQHRVLVTGETPQLYFEESEVLVAAKHLVGKTGVSVVDTMRTTYIHFMFDRHEVVLSDGAWTESFQPGDQTLGSMGEATRGEIIALFPELATQDGLTDYAAARRSLKAHEAKLLQL